MSSCRSLGDSFVKSDSNTKEGFFKSSLWQLVSVRFKEYTREPEALFWSFGFPILLAVGLGIAFRSKPPERSHIAIVRTGAASTALVEGLKRNRSLSVEELPYDSAQAALRTGRVALVATMSDRAVVTYQFDD